MLSFTGAGAVERPKVLQVRLQRSYPGRVRAGAPVPTRSMTEDEVLANLRYFASGGPRALPVTGLVLSGVGVAARADLPTLVAEARGLGITRITLHAGVEDLDRFTPTLGVDLVTLPLQPSESSGALAAGVDAVRTCAASGISVSTNTVLDPLSAPLLMAVARAVIRLGVQSHTYTYPFPVDGGAPGELLSPASAVMALQPAVSALAHAGVRCAIKGLPGCYLGDMASLLRRSGNRWYVDADRQKAAALLFFPNVVAFHKVEDCRFCPVDGACDGFFAGYLRRPGFPALAPMTT